MIHVPIEIRTGDQIHGLPGGIVTIESVEPDTVTVRTSTGSHTHDRNTFHHHLRRHLLDGATYQPAPIPDPA